MEEALRTEKVIITTVIIIEVAHFLIKSLGSVTGLEKMSTFLSYPFIVSDLDYETSLSSIEHLAKFSHLGIGARDATILATMKRLNVNKIMTHDEAFTRIPGIKTMDPLR